MDLKKIIPKNKTGGIISSTIWGIGGLIIGVIVILVVIQTLNQAELLGSGVENTTVSDMTANFTTGLQEVSSKIPTILLIVAVVFLFGALILLVRNTQAIGGSSGGSL